MKGEFKIGKLIGKGSCVYEAAAEWSEKAVAVKLIRFIHQNNSDKEELENVLEYKTMKYVLI